MVREHFEVISDTLPKNPISVFGFRITNSAYGFGSLVLRRVSAQAPRSQFHSMAIPDAADINMVYWRTTNEIRDE
jgi:hypothetical protein